MFNIYYVCPNFQVLCKHSISQLQWEIDLDQSLHNCLSLEPRNRRKLTPAGIAAIVDSKYSPKCTSFANLAWTLSFTGRCFDTLWLLWRLKASLYRPKKLWLHKERAWFSQWRWFKEHSRWQACLWWNAFCSNMRFDMKMLQGFIQVRGYEGRSSWTWSEQSEQVLERAQLLVQRLQRLQRLQLRRNDCYAAWMTKSIKKALEYCLVRYTCMRP